jgi:hypothetical protein
MVLDGGEMMRKVAELELDVIIGGIIGGALSQYAGLMLFNIIGGAFVGGFLGIFVGSRCRKHALRLV